MAKFVIMGLLALGLSGCSPKEPNVIGRWSLRRGHWSVGWFSELHLSEIGGLISGTYIAEVPGRGGEREKVTFKVSGERVGKDLELRWKEEVNRSGIKSLNFKLKGAVGNNKTMSGRFEGKFDYDAEMTMLRLKYKEPSQDIDGLWVAERK